MRAWTEEGYIKALQFAAKAHVGQLWPGTNLPYLLHLTMVTVEVISALRMEPEHDQELAVQCALLHDVIEDAQTPPGELRAAFGQAVADGVAALSKDKRLLPLEEQMPDCLRRIREQPAEIWMVKLADRITNLQPPPGAWGRAKVSRYRAEATQIHNALKDGSPVLATRLAQKIESYRQYEERTSEAGDR